MPHTGSQQTGKREDAQAWGLHVLFLAGGNGVAAQLAAHCARLLTNGGVAVESANPDGTHATAPRCAPAGLVVVIHAPGAPGPAVEHNCGGRVDWHLTVDANEATAELNSQLCRHVMQLFEDLGIRRTHSGQTVMLRACPRGVIDRPHRTNAQASRLAA